MRIVMCYISILITSFTLVGCGQSGALQLASDQNYDKRAKYLLYDNDAPKPAQQKSAPVTADFAAPNIESNPPSTP